MRSQFSSKRREENGKARATAGNVKGENPQGGETGTDLQTKERPWRGILHSSGPQSWLLTEQLVMDRTKI